MLVLTLRAAQSCTSVRAPKPPSLVRFTPRNLYILRVTIRGHIAYKMCEKSHGNYPLTQGDQDQQNSNGAAIQLCEKPPPAIYLRSW